MYIYIYIRLYYTIYIYIVCGYIYIYIYTYTGHGAQVRLHRRLVRHLLAPRAHHERHSADAKMRMTMITIMMMILMMKIITIMMITTTIMTVIITKETQGRAKVSYGPFATFSGGPFFGKPWKIRSQREDCNQEGSLFYISKGLLEKRLMENMALFFE